MHSKFPLIHQASYAVISEDDKQLQKLGYEPILHRGLSAFNNFAVNFYKFEYTNSFCKFAYSFIVM